MLRSQDFVYTVMMCFSGKQPMALVNVTKTAEMHRPISTLSALIIKNKVAVESFEPFRCPLKLRNDN